MISLGGVVNPSVKTGSEEPVLTAPFTQGSLGALPRQCDKLQFEVAEPNRAVMLDNCRTISHEVARGRCPLNCNLSVF